MKAECRNRILSLDEALQLVRRYKQLIAPRFDGKLKVILYGSYAKGSANPWSDIDVAVIVPKVNDDEWLQQSVSLVREGHAVTSLIEPVLMEDHEDSILFDDVMQTGIAV
ncbi:MAG: nucleotidyltransferase domain-containing protein [Bacteroidales bacterium]|nr:nucleotidyltransferase domain-containing protein [Bacteroidales bacterium]